MEDLIKKSTEITSSIHTYVVCDKFDKVHALQKTLEEITRQMEILKNSKLTNN